MSTPIIETMAEEPSTSTSAPTLVIKPPIHWLHIYIYEHLKQGMQMETEKLGRSGNGRTVINALQLKKIVSEEKTAELRTTYAAFGSIPQHMLDLLESGDDIARSMGYVLVKGNILSVFHQWNETKMNKWLPRYINPTNPKDRYQQFEGTLEYEIYLHPSFIFHTPGGYHLICIRDLPRKPDGQVDTRKREPAAEDVVFMQCPQRFAGKLIELNAFCYAATERKDIQLLPSKENVRSVLIAEDKERSEKFNFVAQGHRDPKTSGRYDKEYKAQYAKKMHELFLPFHKGKRIIGGRETNKRKAEQLKAGAAGTADGEEAASEVSNVAGPSAQRGKVNVLVAFGDDFDVSDSDE